VTLALRDVDGRSSEAGHPTILVIDGDPSSRLSLVDGLSAEGFEVVVAEDGEEGLRRLMEASPSLVLLDLFLPDQSGMSLFRRITAMSAVPVIMVTAKDDEIDAVLSLEAGAADHVTKPFRLRELTARIRAVLRRVGSRPATLAAGAVESGPVAINLSLREAVVRGDQVELSRKEFDLLALLVTGSGTVVTRNECMERLWADRRLGDSRTLDTHVKRLRKKIEVDPAAPTHILTVRGIGYRFKP
jgi:two-component system response regulator RegX3